MRCALFLRISSSQNKKKITTQLFRHHEIKRAWSNRRADLANEARNTYKKITVSGLRNERVQPFFGFGTTEPPFPPKSSYTSNTINMMIIFIVYWYLCTMHGRLLCAFATKWQRLHQKKQYQVHLKKTRWIWSVGTMSTWTLSNKKIDHELASWPNMPSPSREHPLFAIPPVLILIQLYILCQITLNPFKSAPTLFGTN